MSTDKTLPAVAWRRPSIYAECLPVFTPLCSEASEWDEEGHQVVPLADHATASARIAELEEQVRDLTAYCARIAELEAQVQELRAFAKDVLKDWPESAPDGFELQELAVSHGLLRLQDPKPLGPCGEDCACASQLYGDEWDGGVDCYRRTPLLLGDAAIAEEKANGA